MRPFSHYRLLGGATLLAAFAAMAYDPAEALAQKRKQAQAPAPIVDKTKPRVVVDHSTLKAGTKFTAAQLAAYIDKRVNEKLAEAKVSPAPRCTDEEFLRRVTLDLTGRIPTAEAAVAFLDDKSADKRAKLIETLLASKEFGKYQADRWQSVLVPKDSDNNRIRPFLTNLTAWLEEQFNKNEGWDKSVRNLLCATGDIDKAGPQVYWAANPTPDKANDNITRAFLGVQLQCAQCHNHPFTDVKQTEYWGMAAFFMRTAPDGNVKAAAKKDKTVAIGEKVRPVNKKRLPESAKIVAPKFYQGESPTVPATGAIRPVLADWMVSAKNPYFAKAMANRVWHQMFGRGIVNPVDDMIDANEPSHAALLADLGGQFAASGFDVKYLYRSICLSNAYQRSSRLTDELREAGPELFATMAVRPLAPGQLYDSLTGLVGAARPNQGKGKGAQAKGQGNARDQFVNFFGAEDGADPTEYQAGIPQVLRLMNAPNLNNAAFLQPIVRGAKSQAEAIEKVYLTILSRRPRPEEVARVEKFLKEGREEPRTAFAGVAWALMNSSEFAMNR